MKILRISVGSPDFNRKLYEFAPNYGVLLLKSHGTVMSVVKCLLSISKLTIIAQGYVVYEKPSKDLI